MRKTLNKKDAKKVSGGEIDHYKKDDRNHDLSKMFPNFKPLGSPKRDNGRLKKTKFADVTSANASIKH